MRASPHRVWVMASVLLSWLACTAELSVPPQATPPWADVMAPVAGAPDRGRDPAIVAVESAAAGVVCAGALIAPDVVLTAAHCAGDGPSALSVRAMAGPSDAPWSAVRALSVPSNGGDADIAALLLDTPVDGVAPLVVRPTGVAEGDHVRTVVLAPVSDGGTPEAIVRDHVPVASRGDLELGLAEAHCTSGCGGPALDDKAFVVGVLSRPGEAVADDSAPGDVAVRTDVFVSFIDGLLSASAPATSAGALKTTHGPVDFGAACAGAVDCAAGVCVSDPPRRYCSRACASGDRCPSGSRCVPCMLEGGAAGAVFEACVQT